MGEDEKLLNEQDATGVEETEASTVEEKEDSPGEKSSPKIEQSKHQEQKYTDEDVNRIVAKKIAAERKRMRKLFEEEQHESDLEKREKAVLRRELVAEAKERLVDEKMPVSLANMFNYNSKEEFEESYKSATEAFNECIREKWKEILKGRTPKGGSPACVDPVAKAFSSTSR